MDLKQAINTVESYLKTVRKLKEHRSTDKMSDYDIYIKNNYDAIEALLKVVKGNTYLVNN